MIVPRIVSVVPLPVSVTVNEVPVEVNRFTFVPFWMLTAPFELTVRLPTLVTMGPEPVSRPAPTPFKPAVIVSEETVIDGGPLEVMEMNPDPDVVPPVNVTEAGVAGFRPTMLLLSLIPPVESLALRVMKFPASCPCSVMLGEFRFGVGAVSVRVKKLPDEVPTLTACVSNMLTTPVAVADRVAALVAIGRPAPMLPAPVLMVRLPVV